MRQTLESCCRQAFTGAAFSLAVAGVVLVLLIAAFRDLYTLFTGAGLMGVGYHRQLLESAAASDSMILALPILSALPYTASYLDDVRSGFIKEYLHRTRIWDYLAGKLGACLLSGGMALVLGLLLGAGVFSLLILPRELVPQAGEAEPWLSGLLRLCGRYFCSGALWSLVGMTLAAATGSKYMAYASPVILYYILIILCERYVPGIYVLYPKEWLNPSHLWVLGDWGVVLLLGELCLLFGGWFLLLGRRRLERL